MKKAAAIAILPLAIAANLAVAQQDCGLANLDPIALDKNQNAEISRDEAQGTTLAWAYEKVDTNGDGIISQPEFAARCSSYQSAGGDQSGTAKVKEEPSALEKAAAEKASQQKERQARKVEGRVDQETDKAVDSVIDRGLDRLFGN